MPLTVTDESETLVRVTAETDEAGRRSYRITLVFPDGTSKSSLPMASLSLATVVAGILNELGLGSKTSPNGSPSVPMYDLLSLLVPGNDATDALEALMASATAKSAMSPDADPSAWVSQALAELRAADDGPQGMGVLDAFAQEYPDVLTAAAAECARAAREQAAQTQA